MKVLTLTEVSDVSGGRSLGDYDEYELMDMGKIPGRGSYESSNSSGSSDRVSDARDLTVKSYGIAAATICGTITGKPLRALKAGGAMGLATLCRYGGEKLGEHAADNPDKVRHPEYESIWDDLF